MIATLEDPQLDREHEEFLELALELSRAQPAGAAAALEALRGHAQAHFAAEDADLRRLGGANATCHIDEHAAVSRSLAEVLDVLQGGAEEDRARHLTESLSDELLRWLPHHIEQMDAGLAAVRCRARHGGAPILMKL